MKKSSSATPNFYSRRVNPQPDWYEEQQISTEPPPPHSLFWQLWSQHEDSAKKSLASPYIQGIKAGNLDPNHYGSYVVTDAYYCFKAAEDYQTAAKRANSHARLQAFLQHKHASYLHYNAQFSKEWHIGDASCILPDPAVRSYSQLESQVCQKEDPIYALIVMLPCEYLWYWLADQIRAAAQDSNLYAFWIQGNLYPKGAYAMGNVLDAYQKEYPEGINLKKAQDYYGKAMQGELWDFREE